MYCPECGKYFDELKNSYDFAERVRDDLYYSTLFLKCPHCKTCLVRERTYRLEFDNEEIYIVGEGK